MRPPEFERESMHAADEVSGPASHTLFRPREPLTVLPIQSRTANKEDNR